jgi:hypothetical protein
LWFLILWAHPMLIGVPAAGWSYFQ